jgi:hypothetical protein
MAIAFDAASNSISAASTHTLPHVIGSSGKDRLLIVTIIIGESRTITSVLYAGLAMTPWSTRAIGGGDAALFMSMYYLVGPPVGTANIVATYSGAPSQGAGMMGVSYTGIDQGSPFMGAAQVTSATSSSAALSIAVASELYGLAIAHYGVRSIGSGSDALTEDAGAVERINVAAGVAGGSKGYAASDETGAASVTMTWDPVQIVDHGMICVSLRRSSDPRPRLASYTDDLASDDRRLLDANGVRLQPWEIRADAWVRYAGWAPPSSVVYDSLVDDPTCGYIEEVSWNSDGDVATTTTSRMDLGEIIIARASAQSNG